VTIVAKRALQSSSLSRYAMMGIVNATISRGPRPAYQGIVAGGSHQ
jgi:hypothetical protein